MWAPYGRVPLTVFYAMTEKPPSPPCHKSNHDGDTKPLRTKKKGKRERESGTVEDNGEKNALLHGTV